MFAVAVVVADVANDDFDDKVTGQITATLI